MILLKEEGGGGLALLLSFKEEVEDEVLPEDPPPPALWPLPEVVRLLLLFCGLMRLRTLEVRFLEKPDSLEDGEEGS